MALLGSAYYVGIPILAAAAACGWFALRRTWLIAVPGVVAAAICAVFLARTAFMRASASDFVGGVFVSMGVVAALVATAKIGEVLRRRLAARAAAGARPGA